MDKSDANRAVERITPTMLGFKWYRAARYPGQFRLESCDGMLFAEQFYALAGELRPG